MTGSKVAMGLATQAVALTLAGLFAGGCRTDAQGLLGPGSQTPPPQVDRPDMAPSPAGEPVADAGAGAQVPSPPPPAVESPADAGPVASDTAAPPIPPPDAAEAGGPAPTWLGPVVRAKDIEADILRAMVIYAKEVEAEEAQIDALTESKDDKRWEMGRGETKISVQSLLAEVIYVEKLKCRRLEAREVHAEVVRIQRR